MPTKEEIVQLLMSNDRAVSRALVVLKDRQTYDEQNAECTKHLNGRGFTAADGKVGTSMAKFFESRGFLTAKQIAYWRRPRKDGKARIAIYAGQLLDIAKEKAARAMTVHPDELEMQRIEAEGDRAQTIRDEANKHRARAVMESYYD
jgi:hypothetical protein